MRRYPAETWAVARRMVVQDGASYAETARETGISESTIQKRAAAEDWQGQRSSTLSYGAQAKALKARLLERILEGIEDGKPDPQLVYAWRQAEAAYPDYRYDKTPQADPKALLAVAYQVLEVVVAYFEEQDRNILTALQPHLRPLAKQLEAHYA